MDQYSPAAACYKAVGDGREDAMAFEQLKAQIALLMDEIAARPSDAHVLQENLREKLAEMRGLGLPLPEDLVELEKALEERFEEAAHPRRTGREHPPERG
jgi:hypothetical protein